ncbi:hypothetical protein HDU81_005368 [Chytriomyces hyalinus]|nr:hypothetical protein HDU81_005368 [Chytriomyces hyalinus]
MKKNPSSSDSESYGPFYSIASSHSTHQQRPPPTPKLSGAEWTLGIPGFTPLPDLFSTVELANFTPMPPKDSEISIAAFYVCSGAAPSARSVQSEGPKKCTKSPSTQNPPPAAPNSPVATQQNGATDSSPTKTTPSLAASACDAQDTADSLQCSKEESVKPLPTPTPSPAKPRRAFSSARAAATAAAAIAAAANTAAAVAAAAAVNNNSSDSLLSSSPQQQSPAKRRGRPPSSFSAKYSAPPPPVPISFFSLIAPSPVKSSIGSLSELEGDDVEGKDSTEELGQDKKLTLDCQSSSSQAGETDATSAASNAEAVTPTAATESPFLNGAGIPTLDSTDSSPVSDSAASQKDAMSSYPLSASPVKHRRQHVLIAKSRRLTDAVALLKEQRRAEAEGLKKLLKSRVGALGTYGAELRRFVVGGSGDLGGKDGEENEQMDEDERGDMTRTSKKGLLKKNVNRHDEGKSVMSDEMWDETTDEAQMSKDILHTAAHLDREKRKRSVSSLTECEIGRSVRRGEGSVNDYTKSAGKANSPTMKLPRKKMRASDKVELPHHFPTHSRRPGSPHSTASGDSNASKLDLTLLLSSAAELLNQSDSAHLTIDEMHDESQADTGEANPAPAMGEGKQEQLQSSGLDLLALLAADGLF